MAYFVPGGSYQQTARDIKTTLTCAAQRRDGSWNPNASFDLTNSPGDIALENINGDLQVTKGATADAQAYVAGGSYLQTSRNILVILHAQLQRRDGSWVPASFNLTAWPHGIQLENIDGVFHIQ